MYTETPMNLRDSIECIRRHEKELHLFNVTSTDTIRDDLETYFETQNVRVAAGQTASGTPEDIAVLSDESAVLAVVDVSMLRQLLEEETSGAGELGIADEKYGRILRHLKETTFTSYDTRQLFYASREIEDRARRTGRGSIHAGFQQCSIMGEQRAVYTDLARRGVSVHAYGVPDVSPPDLGPGRIHAVRTDEIAETWFVVFDGGGSDAQKTALLAQERDDNTFYGIWTYDPGLVDHTLAYLNRTYCSATGEIGSSR